jgi:type VI secretion system secreted protein Hcp
MGGLWEYVALQETKSNGGRHEFTCFTLLSPCQIDITSYSQAFRNNLNFGFGGGGGSGRVSCGDITVLKAIDKASPELIGAVVTGRHLVSGLITFRSSGDGAAEYYKVELSDVLVDAIEQVDPPGDAGLFERVSLKVRQFRFTFRTQKPDGSFTGETQFGWDCASNRRF